MYKGLIYIKNNNETDIKGIPILMYHHFFDPNIGESIPKNATSIQNWLEISTFEKQMRYLKENNYYFPAWDEIYEFVNSRLVLPDKSIVITIDDSMENVFRLAIPIIYKYNIKATLFTITSRKEAALIPYYASSNIIFESHTHNMHIRDENNMGIFLNINEEEAKKDLFKSIIIVGSNDVFCYPFGHYNDFTKKIVKDMGFKLAVTTESGSVYPGTDPLLLPRYWIRNDTTFKNFINIVNNINKM